MYFTSLLIPAYYFLQKGGYDLNSFLEVQLQPYLRQFLNTFRSLGIYVSIRIAFFIGNILLSLQINYCQIVNPALT